MVNNLPMISIIIPCLNEAETIAIVVKKAKQQIEKLHIQGEVIVSDNGSQDGSREIASQAGARVVLCPQKGYGNTLRYGFQQAKGELLIMGDADDSYNFEEIESFLKTLKEHPNTDIAIGNRLQGTIQKGAMPFLHRYLGTPTLTKILNIFFGTHIGDCNCGMRLITKKAIDQLKLESEGMEFASEMIIKAGLLKLNIQEISINFYKDKRTKRPHLKTREDGRRHLRFMLLLAPNFLFFVPGIIASGIGFILLMMQIIGPFKFLGIEMDTHFMILGLTIAILGHMILIMGIFTQIFAEKEGILIKKNILTPLIKKISLEKGLLIGLGIFLIGFGFDVWTLVNWLYHFSQWQGNIEIRKAIIGAYFMILGLLTFFFSFAKSMMKLK